MVKTLGVIFSALLIAITLIVIEGLWGNGFLYKFFREQSIGIVATVLALNIATITFLLGHLVTIESKANKELFSDTKKEIKDNIYFMTGLFAVMFISVALMNETLVWNINTFMFNPVALLALTVFILIFVCLFEILNAIFHATRFIESKTEK